ncbi:MAG TPA: Scr1 family TA system antitoxin-like transcriptional regulator [Pseudonocardiaceae bacterium]|nr:Scr1 family TA system antitoxin-like transcriptional regulator [Pseudonocardiaceae bacterium]
MRRMLLQTLLGQLDRFVAVVGLATVELGVVPFATPLPVFPLTGFVLYDDAVLIESITGQQRLDAANEVALYERFFDQLRDAAATGPDAAALIQRVAAELRR